MRRTRIARRKARRIGLRHKTLVAAVGGVIAVIPALAAGGGTEDWASRMSTVHTRDLDLVGGGVDPGGDGAMRGDAEVPIEIGDLERSAADETMAVAAGKLPPVEQLKPIKTRAIEGRRASFVRRRDCRGGIAWRIRRSARLGRGG